MVRQHLGVLVTGANGFVGRALVARLRTMDQYIKCANRSIKTVGECQDNVIVGDINGDTNWSEALEGVDTVVHLAARVHVMKEHSTDPLTDFCKVNVDGTERLARQAAAAQVRRLIYVSSIKVNGESTDGRTPFSESDSPSPTDPYAVSKWRAEEVLRRVAQETGLEVVIIRPPLVYGADVKANFLDMMRWLKSGLPLPFGSIDNRRSLVSLDNLVDLLVICINHPKAANQTFLVADGEDISTTQLLVKISAAIGRPARLLPIPAPVLIAGATLVGKRPVAQRLCGSLQVDISRARELLGWTPPKSMDEALRETAVAFLKGEGRVSRLVG